MVLSERPKEYTIVISNVILAIAIDSNTFVVFGFSLKNIINLLTGFCEMVCAGMVIFLR